jgi:hypothetical protein
MKNNALKPPGVLYSKIMRTAPTYDIEGDRRGYFGGGSEESFSSFESVLVYIQKGLGDKKDLIKQVVMLILQVQEGGNRKYPLVPMAFGNEQTLIHEKKYFELGYLNDAYNNMRITEVLSRLSSTQEVDKAVIPELFPKTDARSLYHGKTRVTENDLLVIIGRKNQVFFDESLKLKLKVNIRKHVLFVEIEDENVNWIYKNYKPVFINLEKMQNYNSPKKMTTDLIFEYIGETLQYAAAELIKTYFDSPNKKSALVFPRFQANEKRVSEQEFRYAFIHAMSVNNKHGFTFSIETPTRHKYKFLGVNGRSASSDLSLYNGHEMILNTEFKYGNAIQSSISKDIEKLIKEDCIGVWGHIFKNEDSGTVKRVFEKLVVAFQHHGLPKKPFFFSFLILGSQKLITRRITESDVSDFMADKFFKLDYNLYKGLIKDQLVADGWLIQKVNY